MMLNTHDINFSHLPCCVIQILLLFTFPPPHYKRFNCAGSFDSKTKVAVVGIARTDLGFGWRFFSIQTDSVLSAKARELYSVAEQSEKWDG